MKYDGQFAKIARECTCAGAFGMMVPDHAVAVVNAGNGVTVSHKRKSLYDYADSKDFVLRESEADVTPYPVDPSAFTFLAYSDGRFVDRVEAPGLLSRLQASLTFPLQVTIDVDENEPEDFRFSIKTVRPVMVEDRSNIRLGHDERRNLRQKDYRASPPSYEYFATASFVFDSREEARNEGWGV